MEDVAADFAFRRNRERRRYYARNPHSMKNVIARLLTEKGYGRFETSQQLQEAWLEAVDSSLASKSRAVRIQRGQLEVLVSNSTIMQEFTFQKRRILANLRKRMPEARIRDLRFRVGPVE